MKRKAFLQSLGLAAGAAILPKTAAKATEATQKMGQKMMPPSPTCELIPTETAGPFPLDLTANNYYFRKDITEGQPGIKLNLKLRVIGKSNCQPMQNLRLNIWHCTNKGVYSGYNNNMNAGDVNAKHLRGYQFTDANGEAAFTTIFPGWYNGRICHIHFQVFVSSVYAAISQLTFPISEKNALYLANPSLYPSGSDPKTFATDNIFSDGYQYQLGTLTKNADGSYDSFLEVTINGSGVLATMEPETGGQFRLGQNFPNPHSGKTTVPFELENASEVALAIFDLQGREVGQIPAQKLEKGARQIEVDLSKMGLPTANYAYQLQVSNQNGRFQQAKMMTAF